MRRIAQCMRAREQRGEHQSIMGWPLTMRSSEPRGQALAFREVLLARGRPTRR